MNFDITPLGRVEPRIAADAAKQTVAAPASIAASFDVRLDTLPAAPPSEVLQAVEAAAARARWLHEQGRELRFQPVEAGHRIRVEVRDLDGRVIRTIPPSEALGIVSGEVAR